MFENRLGGFQKFEIHVVDPLTPAMLCAYWKLDVIPLHPHVRLSAIVLQGQVPGAIDSPVANSAGVLTLDILHRMAHILGYTNCYSNHLSRHVKRARRFWASNHAKDRIQKWLLLWSVAYLFKRTSPHTGSPINCL